MIISLIGMSNCGKSHWSKKLEQAFGFRRLSCDDMIAAQLSEVLPAVDITDMDAFAAWMGMPHEFGYQEREAAYLAGEEGALSRAIEQAQGDTVIDTTGSAIYLSERVLRRLKQVSTIVYLAPDGNQIDQMTNHFFSCPKPLVWGDRFEQQAGETPEGALSRCYPDLLSHRISAYKILADIEIPYGKHRSPLFTEKDLHYEVLQHQR